MRDEFSSFRDPSGMIFESDGIIYRQINACYREQYDQLMACGLYNECVEAGELIEHTEMKDMLPARNDERAYAVIRPTQVPFISYPYEWCFGQYREAALKTLRLHRRALDKGMILKDASAYNMQFVGGQMKLIDTLSFERYEEGRPWVAYGQFCRHFLAPLMLMAYCDVRMGQLMRVYIDGIPLDLASKLLKGKGGMAAKQHIHWHARATQKHAEDGHDPSKTRELKLGKFQHVAMIDSLIRIVEGLHVKAMQTEWGDYYDRTNYSDAATQAKEALVREFAQAISPKTLWDFGANNGHYTRIAAEDKAFAVAFDIDPVAVECNYQAIGKSGETNILPLLLDMTNPSPAIGFANRERGSIGQRMRPDCILALAVIHHMAISNNLPLVKIADWLAELSDQLIIEFVPKEDSQVQTLLSTRDDIFPDYTKQGFEQSFQTRFEILRSEPIAGSCRTLYLMKRKGL